MLAFTDSPPFYQIIIYLLTEGFAALQGNNTQRSDGYGLKISCFFAL